MSVLDNPVTGPLELYLNLLAQREKIIVANMANVDTPHFHTLDLDFGAELRRVAGESNGGEERPPASNAGGVELREAAFETGTLPPPVAVLPPRVVEVQGLIERPDGNNVSLDRESMLLAEVQLQFRMGAQLLHHTFQQLMQLINEGGPNQ